MPNDGGPSWAELSSHKNGVRFTYQRLEVNLTRSGHPRSLIAVSECLGIDIGGRVSPCRQGCNRESEKNDLAHVALMFSELTG